MDMQFLEYSVILGLMYKWKCTFLDTVSLKVLFTFSLYFKILQIYVVS